MHPHPQTNSNREAHIDIYPHKYAHTIKITSTHKHTQEYKRMSSITGELIEFLSLLTRNDAPMNRKENINKLMQSNITGFVNYQLRKAHEYTHRHE